MGPLSILFLCRKYYYLHKMSRVRFHAVRAIGKLCHVLWSGPEWENWDGTLTAKENIDLLYSQSEGPDMVLAYRPEEIEGFASIPNPTCVNRDEMFTDEIPAERTVARIRDNKIDLVISHQRNQLHHPLFSQLPCRFAHIPYCADSTIFCDYGLVKEIDVLLIGNLAELRYPLRAKLFQYLLKMRGDSRFRGRRLFSYPYPGYRLKEAYNESHVIDFAKTINASKICLTCCGKYHLKYAKYIEVPACKSMLMADMPDEDQEILKRYMVEIDPELSYDELAHKIRYYLDHDEERAKLTEKGFAIAHENYTQTRYAEDFVEVVREYLKKYGSRKVWPQDQERTS